MITLELIAPYLPYGPTLETLDGPQQLSLELLTTIENLDKMHPGTKQTFWADSTLCLKGFSALCDKLPDGTVPLREIARALGKQADGDCEIGGVRNEHAFVFARHPRAISPVFVITVQEFSEDDLPGATRRELLRWHFAVGLEPHQYIVKASG